MEVRKDENLKYLRLWPLLIEQLKISTGTLSYIHRLKQINICLNTHTKYYNSCLTIFFVDCATVVGHRA